MVTFNYDNGSNDSEFVIKEYYKDGNLEKELPVRSGHFVDRIVKFYKSGKIMLIDSLSSPCDTVIKDCDLNRTIFYENGKIAENFKMQNGKYNGWSRHFDRNGIIVKEYFLIDDTIKNGEYKEYDDSGRLSILKTYRNDTLIGNSYFFNSNGDTVKYYFNENGLTSLPYKKWLGKDTTLVGTYDPILKDAILWTWYKKWY